jgi:hypothetical protein
VYSADWTPLEYDESKAVGAQPLKGFMPYEGEYDFPHSMEYSYFGLSDLMKGSTEFTFEDTLEPFLQRVTSRGHQAVFRVFLDYPNHRLSIPQYLLDGGLNLNAYTEHGGGLCPDYDDESLVQALELFIAELGNRYDGDTRIGFIQVGLLGHWGEWHTWPNIDWFPSVATQNRIIAAYDNAFSKTHVLLSQDALGQVPLADVASAAIGFHDDDFTNNTLPPGDYQFWSRMERLELDQRWLIFPIGGEIQPAYQQVIWDVPSGAPENYLKCVTTTHASWLLNHALFTNDWAAAKMDRAKNAASHLGYQLTVRAVKIKRSGSELSIGVKIENVGIAPFYYNWPVEVALVSNAGDTMETVSTEWDMREVKPEGGEYEWHIQFAPSAAVTPQVQVSLRVVNPLERGLPLRFANASQGEEWLILGTVPPVNVQATSSSFILE